MRLRRTVAGLWLATVITAPTPDAATDPAAGCAAAKRKAVGKCAFETLKCYAEAARRGAFVEPRCRERAEARLAQAFARAEQRGGCATSGDAGVLQAEVDVFVEGVVAALPTLAPPTVTTTSSKPVGGDEPQAAALRHVGWRRGGRRMSEPERRFDNGVERGGSYGTCPPE